MFFALTAEIDLFFWTFGPFAVYACSICVWESWSILQIRDINSVLALLCRVSGPSRPNCTSLPHPFFFFVVLTGVEPCRPSSTHWLSWLIFCLRHDVSCVDFGSIKSGNHREMTRKLIYNRPSSAVRCKYTTHSDTEFWRKDL